MSDVFISYARSTAQQAQAVAEALRGLGYSVWIDDDLPAHRTYSRVIEEQMTAAKAAVVIWSADAVQSEWVLSEANRAREDHKLVQVTTDKSRLPMPFDTIQCADLAEWTGDTEAPGWRKVTASIADLIGAAAALPATDTPLSLPSKPSIAVLPFTNLSGDAEQDYFADGMVVEITNALSRSRSLFVVASGSTLSFKGNAVSPQEIARQLGVRYVLEGSVRRAAGRVRITVQLIDATDSAQIWTNRFEDTLEDVFALQDKVALAVAGKIEPTVQQAETRRASARPTDNMGSYDLTLRSLALLRTYTKADMLEALRLAERAVEIDPNYGSAMSLAAICHYIIGIYGWSDDAETQRRQSLEMARRTIRAAGDDATALSYAAMIVGVLGHDVDAAGALIDRALALNPGSAEAWLVSGMAKVRVGQLDLGIEQLETAMRLDPMGPSRSAQLVWIAVARFRQQRFGETIVLAKEVLQQTEMPLGYSLLAASYGHLGQTTAAMEALTRYRALSAIPIEANTQTISDDPVYVELFLKGIALAEGKSPSATDAAEPTT